MANIFDAIKFDIARTGVELPGSKRWFGYKLPRQCGSSTFMASFANERAETGEKVLYIEQKAYAMQGFGISEKVTVMPHSGGYQYWLHKLIYTDKPFDWIICDNLGFPKASQWFISNVKHGAQKGVLWIDTVEGELIKFTDN